MTIKGLLPDIVTITPTSFEAWTRCRRQFLDAQLLGIPASDAAPSADYGLLVHELLRLVHERGSCHDRDFVTDTLASHGVEGGLVATMIERHAQRCPRSFVRARHEIDVARFHRLPAPMFLTCARIDAVFVHDGILDVRDYKTGGRSTDRVADDPRAQVQAWSVAVHAQRRGLRLQLRYEQLAPEVDDDPEPWEPDQEELDAVEARISQAVAAMWAEQDWTGVADAIICRTCRYRSICPHSATPGEPSWPVLAVDLASPPA